MTYLASDVLYPDIKVAIKEFFPSAVAGRGGSHTVSFLSEKQRQAYESGLQGFVREAQILAGIRHPNVVQVLRVIPKNQTAYLVMEYCQGQSLAQRLAEPGFVASEAWLVSFLRQMLEGLGALHAKKVLHRDIKPSNIFLLEDERPVLIDFGAARQLIEQETQTLSAIVSSGYAPLEQHDPTGNLSQGPYTDLYGLGATAYHIVTGRAPAPAGARALRDPVISAQERAQGKLSRRVLEGIDRALRVKPEERFQTAQEWLDELAGQGRRSEPTPSRSEAKDSAPPKRKSWLVGASAALLPSPVGGRLMSSSGTIGAHAVVLQRADGSVERSVTVNATDTTRLNEMIFPGWVTVFSPFNLNITEGSRPVRLDDRNQVMLPSGSHELRFENRALGYEEVRKVDIKSGAVTTLSIVPARSSLTVTSSVPGEVWLELGTREVVLRTPDGDVRRFTVTVTTRPVTLDASPGK